MLTTFDSIVPPYERYKATLSALHIVQMMDRAHQKTGNQCFDSVKECRPKIYYLEPIIEGLKWAVAITRLLIGVWGISRTRHTANSGSS